MIKPIKEYLLCSAIHYNDEKVHEHQPRNINSGFVICGRRHHNCLIVGKIFNARYIKDYHNTQGFLTNLDRFVDREEGQKVALGSGQLKEPKNLLFSEDLW